MRRGVVLGRWCEVQRTKAMSAVVRGGMFFMVLGDALEGGAGGGDGFDCLLGRGGGEAR